MTTQAQKIHLNAELWPAACRHQGWSPKDREKLYDVYARVLGEREPHKTKLAEGGRISACDFVQEAGRIDRKQEIDEPGRDDFGDVKRELLILAGKDLVPDNSVKHNRLWTIRNRLMPCYRVYRPEVALETILRERFNRVRLVNGIEDLGSDDLKKLIYTMESRINVCRNDAGHTHHQMCDKAGVQPWRCPKSCGRCAQLAIDARDDKEWEKAQEIDEDEAAGRELGLPEPEYVPPENSEHEAF